MKSKSIALISAAIITAAAFILTAGLSLLNISAIEESLIPVETAVPDASEVIEDGIEDIIDGENYDDEFGVEEENDFEYPVYEYILGDAKEVYDSNPYGVIIDIFSHKTGEAVGQLAFNSKEICNYISELKGEWHESNLGIYTDSTPLPKGDYRVEVYAGTWFAYTYGANNMFEFTQSAVAARGGAKMTGYIDFLIEDYIAEIEAGNAVAPEITGAELSRCIEDWTNIGRKCERFPYLGEESVDDNDVTEEEETAVPDYSDTSKYLIENQHGFNHIYEVKILVDVYEHETGKLVGRIDLSNYERFYDIDELVHCDYILDPDFVSEEEARLDYAKYRIEVFSLEENVDFGGYRHGLFFAYSYGADSAKIELGQIGMCFDNNAEVIAYIDALIADGIAEIEAGNGVIPEVSGAEFTQCTDYWDHSGRFVERFPYLND